MGKRILEETRELLGELLGEARLRVGDRAYYLPDSVADRVINRLDLEAMEGTHDDVSQELGYVEAKLPSDLLKSLENLPEELKTEASLIYAEYRKEIDSHRGSKQAASGPSRNTGNWGKPAKWKEQLYNLKTGDRAGAIGKGEILACFFWRDAKLAEGANSNTASVDIQVGNKFFSVKASEAAKSYKVNGVKPDFSSKLVAGLQSFGITGKLITLAASDSDLTQENILGAIGSDSTYISADDKAKALLAFLKSADGAVRKMTSKSGPGEYDYLFVSSQGWEKVSHASTRIVFESTTQDKVAIKLLDSAADDTRTLSSYAADPTHPVWSRAGKSKEQIFIEEAGGASTTVGQLIDQSNKKIRTAFSKLFADTEPKDYKSYVTKPEFDKKLQRVASQALAVRVSVGTPLEEDINALNVEQVVNFITRSASPIDSANESSQAAKHDVLRESRFLLAELFPSHRSVGQRRPAGILTHRRIK